MKKIYTIVLILTSLTIQAQENTLYFMNAIPQSMSLNPAIQPGYNGYGVLPLNINLDINNSFSLSQVFKKKDTSYLVDYGSLPEKNMLKTNVHSQLFGAGWRMGRDYWSLGVDLKASNSFVYPNTLLSIFEEDPTYTNIDLSNSAITGSAYINSYIGYSRQFKYDNRLKDYRLTLGGRVRYLTGLGIVKTDLQHAVFLSTLETTTAGAEGDIYYTYPDIDNISGLSDAKGIGGAIDLGVNYVFNDELTLSAGLIDAGLISWKDVVQTHFVTTSETFEGIDLSADNSFEMDSFLTVETTTDTLASKVFWLHPTAYFAGSYNLAYRTSIGAVARITVYPRYIDPELTISLNQGIGRYVSLSASYSIEQNQFSNVGLGLSFNLAPVQLYIVSDNALGLMNITRGTLDYLANENSFNEGNYLTTVNGGSISLGVNLLLFSNKEKRDKHFCKTCRKKDKKRSKKEAIETKKEKGEKWKDKF